MSTTAPAWASAAWIPGLEVLELPWLDEYREHHGSAVAACLAAESAREQLDARFAAEDRELECQALSGEPLRVDEATPLADRAQQQAEATAAWVAAWDALRALVAEQAAELSECLPGDALEALRAADGRLTRLPLSRRQRAHEAARRDDVALTAFCQSLEATGREVAAELGPRREVGAAG